MTGRHPQPEDPYGRHSGPAPRGHDDQPVAGRRPGPGPTPGPRPEPGRPPSEHSEAPSEWDSDENTYMISKLGYVPKESRSGHSPEYFDTETVTAADRSKFRTRKRAKKTSPVSKILIGFVGLVVFAAIGFGAWFLIGSGDDDDNSGLTYAATKKPCEQLDTSPMDPVIGKSKVKENRSEVEEHAHSTEQVCDVSYGQPGKGGSIAVSTQVFGRDAGAKNAYEDSLDEAKENKKEAEETGGGSQKIDDVTGIGSKAYQNVRKATAESKSVDYELVYYEDNAFIKTRISSLDGKTTLDDVAKYAKAVAKKYMENWAAA